MDMQNKVVALMAVGFLFSNLAPSLAEPYAGIANGPTKAGNPTTYGGVKLGKSWSGAAVTANRSSGIRVSVGTVRDGRVTGVGAGTKR
jgi:hypothetical protein